MANLQKHEQEQAFIKWAQDKAEKEAAARARKQKHSTCQHKTTYTFRQMLTHSKTGVYYARVEEWCNYCHETVNVTRWAPGVEGQSLQEGVN